MKGSPRLQIDKLPQYPSQQKPFSNPWRLLVANLFRNKGCVVITMNNLCISACDDCIERSKSLTSHSVFKLLCSLPLPYWTSSKDVFAMQCSQCKAKDVVAAKKNIGQSWLKECNWHTVGRSDGQLVVVWTSLTPWSSYTYSQCMQDQAICLFGMHI